MDSGIIKANDRLYYTGDMANSSDWVTVTNVFFDRWGEHLDITYVNSGRRSRIEPCAVGDVYSGTCNPRFVTEQAFTEYRNRQGLRGPGGLI